MVDSKPVVTAVRRIVLVVADIERAEQFFADAFAFAIAERRDDPGLPALLGLPTSSGRETIMRLGDQEIGLLAFDPPGRPYPQDSTSSDLWFQHFAIIVSDMAAAVERLRAVGGFTAISEGGPQHLPEAAGSVSAFKFRDGEGHPLELLAFPAGGEPDPWREKTAAGVFLGIDHSAIAVSDTARSLAFYRDCLGLSVAAQTENHGEEQSRLDALPGAVVTVTGLKPAVRATPHVELLGYKVGSRRPIPSDTRSDDRAASFFLLETDALSDLVEALVAVETRFVSPGVVALAGGEQAIAVLDPDGHRLVITQR